MDPERYQRRLADQVEVALSNLPSLDWYLQLPDDMKAHVQELLRNPPLVEAPEGEPLAVPQLNYSPSEKLIVMLAVLLTGYEVQIMEIQRSLRPGLYRSRGAAPLPGWKPKMGG